jgi:hypothetical protein
MRLRLNSWSLAVLCEEWWDVRAEGDLSVGAGDGTPWQRVAPATRSRAAVLARRRHAGGWPPDDAQHRSARSTREAPGHPPGGSQDVDRVDEMWRGPPMESLTRGCCLSAVVCPDSDGAAPLSGTGLSAHGDTRERAYCRNRSFEQTPPGHARHQRARFWSVDSIRRVAPSTIGPGPISSEDSRLPLWRFFKHRRAVVGTELARLCLDPLQCSGRCSRYGNPGSEN